MFSPSNFLIFQIVPPLFSPILFSPCRQVRQLVWCTILEMPMWVKSKSRWPFFLPDHISFCLVYDQNPKEASLSKAFGFSHPSSSSSCLSCSSYSPDSRILCEASRLVSYAAFIPSVTFVSLLLLLLILPCSRQWKVLSYILYHLNFIVRVHASVHHQWKLSMM